MASRDDSRVVFVGNIPYDGTEQQLAEQFSEVGTVVSFRLVNDRETGKPKGFGFCEYKDAETARSAIRNLNGILFHGRALRVDTADDDQASTPAARPLASQQSAANGAPKEKLGIDAIGQVVDSLSNEQQVEILAQMKQLIESDPDGARRLLQENQQLAQAMLRLLIVFDAVKPEDIQSLSAVPMSVVQPPSQPANQFAEAPMPMQYEAGPHQAPPPANYHMMHRGPPPAMMPGPGMPQGPPHALPPHGAPGPGPRPRRPMTSLPPQKAQLLQTIMSMTPEQFAALSPEMQQKVAILRSRIGARGAGMMQRPPMGGPPPRSY